MLLAFLGTAAAILSFAFKSRLEEARMAETFPEYVRYRRETAALAPGPTTENPLDAARP